MKFQLQNFSNFFSKPKQTGSVSIKAEEDMSVSMRDLDPAFQGAGQKAYPLPGQLFHHTELPYLASDSLILEQ